VSISASAAIATAQAPANLVTSFLGPVWVTASKGAEATGSSSMKPALRLVASPIAIIFLQPFANGAVQNRGDGNFAKARLTLQIGL
jgi:hypothetical protein